jgi:hypothetical protein
MVSPPRHPRGQQRDKIYREALRLELADMSEGVDLKKLREIAKVHIEKAAAGDMQAIKELRDTLDGKPAMTVEPVALENGGVKRIVWEIVHTDAAGKPLPDGEVITMPNGEVITIGADGREDGAGATSGANELPADDELASH